MKNKAIQTRRPHIRDRATQEEAEAIPSRNPSHPGCITHQLLFLAAASGVLSWIATIAGPAACPLSTRKPLPSSTVEFFRSSISVFLVVLASKFFVTHVSAAVTTIAELPEATFATATAFLADIATGYLLVQRPFPDTEEASEVLDKDKRADE